MKVFIYQCWCRETDGYLSSGSVGKLVKVFGVFPARGNIRVAELEREALVALAPFTADVRFKHKEGRDGRLLMHSTPSKLVNDHIVWNGVVLDITERKHIQEEMQRLATTDPLTGLFNRRHFFEIADKEFAKSLRYQRPS